MCKGRGYRLRDMGHFPGHLAGAKDGKYVSQTLQKISNRKKMYNNMNIPNIRIVNRTTSRNKQMYVKIL